MLTQLHIQGLAIIDSLTIHFVPGFNVITGETGAGKSILIKALGLLLGAKASAETVRRGRSNATVSGFFDIPAAHPYAGVLEHYGIGAESADGVMQVLVRRTVTDKGRSLAWINDTPVTVTVLRELALSLIDVFGQHDNLRLLDAVQHVDVPVDGAVVANLAKQVGDVEMRRADTDEIGAHITPPGGKERPGIVEKPVILANIERGNADEKWPRGCKSRQRRGR